ncbi:hypothetical protein [Gimesia panareensis]|uniref:hypothetical protein n=1 Tax=Gimesia panareensis TaxID=2527978 RepID=UPI001187DE48|nr:hypothetical protein [Gimesia panareensis]QDU50673.1 hypothetical protein Pan110_30260 [Gimesia panareensis]
MKTLWKVCFFALAICWATSGELRADATDEALARAYEKLKSDPNLKDEKSRHQKLMEMADEYNKLAEVAFQSTEDLEQYAYKVRLTGLLFRTSLPGVKQFHKNLKVVTEHSAFKNFQKYAGIKQNLDTVIGLGSQFKNTLENPDLPPSAKNTLLFLHTVGTGLEQLSDIPLVGPVLEGYGKIANGLGETMNELAGKVTTTAKADVFSLTEEKELLGGLPKGQYIKTPLWHRGIPIVHEWPYAQGKDRFYLQMPDQKWARVDYDEIASIAADYYLTEKKNPDVKTILKYVNNQEERESLRFWANTELEFERIKRILGDVPGVNRSRKYSQFTAIETKIKRWHKGLSLPLEYAQLEHLIRAEYENPGSAGRAIRKRVIRAYPGFALYLGSLKEDPMSMNMELLLKRFAEYRTGNYLPSKHVVLGAGLFPSIPADLPAGWFPQRYQEPNPRLEGVPQKIDNPGSAYEWAQYFWISNEQGSRWTGREYYLDREKRSTRFLSVFIYLTSRYDEYTYEGKAYRHDKKDGLKAMVENAAIDCDWYGTSKNAALNVRKNYFGLHFVRHDVYVQIDVSYVESKASPWNRETYLTLLKHFSKIVVDKINEAAK